MAPWTQLQSVGSVMPKVLSSRGLFVILNHSTIILIATISDALTVSLKWIRYQSLRFQRSNIISLLIKNDFIILDVTSSYICNDLALPPWTYCTWNDFTHSLSPSALIPTVPWATIEVSLNSLQRYQGSNDLIHCNDLIIAPSACSCDFTQSIMKFITLTKTRERFWQRDVEDILLSFYLSIHFLL